MPGDSSSGGTPVTPNDLAYQDGITRTDMHCTECRKGFIALLDFSLDGNHTVECPHCGHWHHRVIKGGVVTDDRWNSSVQQHVVPSRSVWKADSQPITTSVASAFIRDRWMKHGL